MLSQNRKVSVSKKLLFESPPAKRLCLSTESCEQSKELSRFHLESLRKRIREKQESINNLKTTLSYKKKVKENQRLHVNYIIDIRCLSKIFVQLKNKAEDLETAIKKWTDICQIALRDYQNNLQERNGYCTNMTEILSSFNIDPSIVCFSTDDDTFC